MPRGGPLRPPRLGGPAQSVLRVLVALGAEAAVVLVALRDRAGRDGVPRCGTE